jgi:hypothetical protein
VSDIDLTTPQATVAHHFMAHKGYKNAEPCDVEKLDNQPCWYFLYRLPEGNLELEVFYNSEIQDWEATVTVFTLAS